MNLIEGLNRELERVIVIRGYYEEIPQGAFALVFINQSIKNAQKAMAEGDVVKMLKAYNELKEIE